VPAVGEANRMQPRPASGFSLRWAALDGRSHPQELAAARVLGPEWFTQRPMTTGLYSPHFRAASTPISTPPPKAIPMA